MVNTVYCQYQEHPYKSQENYVKLQKLVSTHIINFLLKIKTIQVYNVHQDVLVVIVVLLLKEHEILIENHL